MGAGREAKGPTLAPSLLCMRRCLYAFTFRKLMRGGCRLPRPSRPGSPGCAPALLHPTAGSRLHPGTRPRLCHPQVSEGARGLSGQTGAWAHGLHTSPAFHRDFPTQSWICALASGPSGCTRPPCGHCLPLAGLHPSRPGQAGSPGPSWTLGT